MVVHPGPLGRPARTLALAAALAASVCTVAAEPEPPRRTARRAGTEDVAAPPTEAAPAAPVPSAVATEAADEAAARAARLGLGTHTSVVHLFVGPAPEDWVREAGGAEPPAVLGWPLQGAGRWLRGYGAGRDGHPSDHRGIDVADELGAPILSAAEGLVAYAGHELRGYGNAVVVLHPAGWVTLYGHASELVARPGQLVARGDVIARVGHTGNAGGDHVHFELRRDGHKVNPLAFLEGAPIRVRSAAPLPLPPRVRVHRVKQSDALSRVARGSGMSASDLARLNGLDPRDVLSVGHRLLIVRSLPAGLGDGGLTLRR